MEWKPRYYKGRSYVPVEAVAAFYGFRNFNVTGKQVSMTMNDPPIKFEATVGEKRMRLNRMVFYFSFPIVSFSGRPAMISSFDVSNLLDPILRPQARRDPAVLRVVVLDPAGGGVEGGITTEHGFEKEVTLDVAKRLKPLLERAGFTVVMVREGDEAVFPLERVRLANLIRDEAVYISLRVNYSGAPNARGIETSTLPPASTPATFEPETDQLDKRFFPGNISDRESMALATLLQNNLITGTKANDLGIKRLRVEELRGIEMPAVVCRLGFLSHKEEGPTLLRNDYRETLARSLCAGVQRYAAFLSKNLEQRKAEDARRPLYFGKLQATHLDSSAGIAGERITIRVPIIAAPNVVVDRTRLEVQLFVFEKVNGIELDITVANAPKIEWLTVLPDWKGTQTEIFQVLYERPPLSPAETLLYGRRQYYGYVARLIYNGQLLDESADPGNLKRCLYYFTPVRP